MTRNPRPLRKKYILRDRSGIEVPWARASELAKLDLPRPVVVVNGAFDILHSGHMKIIHTARRYGRTVIVALDSDKRVARKGDGRPIQSFVERATTLNYMPVDYIVEIENDGDMGRLFNAVSPDLRVQGQDYINHKTKFPSIPKAFVRQGRMRTTELIRRCRKTPE